MVVYRKVGSLLLFGGLRKEEIMEKELNGQEAAYTQQNNETPKTHGTEAGSAERDFWLSVKYSDEHSQSER